MKDNKPPNRKALPVITIVNLILGLVLGVSPTTLNLLSSASSLLPSLV